MAGLARAYRATGAERYLNTLESAVDYYCEQSPSDGIPYWDLEAPEIPEEPRDTSAAAIAAYGLIHLGNIENKDRYEVDRLDPLVNYGEHILSSLVSEYLITTSSEGPLGVVRAGCFNAPGNYATEAELIWTTYYLAYSLTWLLDFG